MDISLDPITASPAGRNTRPPTGDTLPVAIRELVDAIPLALAVVDTNLKLAVLNERMAVKIRTGTEMCVGRRVCEIMQPVGAQLETCMRRVLAGNPADADASCSSRTA